MFKYISGNFELIIKLNKYINEELILSNCSDFKLQKSLEKKIQKQLEF